MKKVLKSKEQIFKDIASGKYRDFYLIYNRKSTDEADNQKNSISYQRAENERFAINEQVQIAPITINGFCTEGVISEKHSGFKEGDDLHISDDGLVQYRIDRPKFQQMVQFVNQGYFKGIVCLCWDRISRNKGDDTVIRKLMRKGVSVRFVHAHYDKSSAGELHMDIDGMFAQHHSRVTSEKVTMSTRNSRSKGKCTYRAPIGYLNTGTMDIKPLDPQRAPVIKEMFELYATGDWSLSDIARHANQQGFTTVPMRRRRSREEMLADEGEDEEIEKTTRPINENHVSRILTNYFYTGRVIGPEGIYIPSISHEALVDDETFQTVQTLLRKKTVSIHYTEKLDHPLRGLVRCAHCGRIYTPYTKKGILYFNSRCIKGCTNTMKNCNFNFVAKQARSFIEKLHFTDEELIELDARTSTGISLLEEKRHKEFEKIDRQKKRAREDLAYIRSNRLTLLKTGVYTPEGLIEEETKLKSELDQLLESEQVSETAMAELVKDIVTLSELIKNAIPIYDFANPHEKERIVRTIFSELYIAQDVAEYKVKKGFETFDNRKSALCDPTENRTPIFRMKT